MHLRGRILPPPAPAGRGRGAPAAAAAAAPAAAAPLVPPHVLAGFGPPRLAPQNAYAHAASWAPGVEQMYVEEAEEMADNLPVTVADFYRDAVFGPGGAVVVPVGHLTAVQYYSGLAYTEVNLPTQIHLSNLSVRVPYVPNGAEDIAKTVSVFIQNQSRLPGVLGDLLRAYGAMAGARLQITLTDQNTLISVSSITAPFDPRDRWQHYLGMFAHFLGGAAAPGSDNNWDAADGVSIRLRLFGSPAPATRHTRLRLRPPSPPVRVSDLPGVVVPGAPAPPGAAAAAAAVAGAVAGAAAPGAVWPPPPPVVPAGGAAAGPALPGAAAMHRYALRRRYGGGELTEEEKAQREVVTKMRCVIRTEMTPEQTCVAQVFCLAMAHAQVIEAEKKQPKESKEQYAKRQEHMKKSWAEYINRHKRPSGEIRSRFLDDALELHRRFFPTGQPLTPEQVMQLENETQTRIIIYRWRSARDQLQVEYKGNAKYKRFGVGLAFGLHLDYVVDILSLLRKARADQPFRLCLSCAEVVSAARPHHCEGVCPACQLLHEHNDKLEPQARELCPHCNRTLRADCFEAHLAQNVCSTTWLCTKCDRLMVRAREQPHEHSCEKRFCRACCQPREANHLCSMGTLKPHKTPLRKIIVFDFETMCDPKTCVHTVNLAVAQYFEDDKGDDNYYVFSNLDDFCAWLFQPEHKGYTVIAHNLRGYDGHFILQWLDRQSVWSYNPTYRGSSIVGFTTKEKFKMVFLDSYSHIGVALREFTKVFDLDPARYKKGDYPYRFNTPENQHYRGPLPALAFYGEKEFMPEERWKELERWHKEEEKKGAEFDQDKELLEYCKSDVRLLREGLRHYQAEMYKLTRVDPLRKLTIASQAMTVFRTNFLEKGAVPMLSLQLQNMIREGYYGGFTEAFQPLHYFRNGECGRAVDVCSMYPWAMFYNEFPVGHPETHMQVDLDLKLHRGFAKVTVQPPDDLLLPVLPSRSEGKLLFDLQGPKTGVWSTEELKYAVERGYKILATEWVIHWKQWSNKLFRGYIRIFFLLKTLASGTKLTTFSEKLAYLEQHMKALEMTIDDEAVTAILRSHQGEGEDVSKDPRERERVLVELLKPNAAQKAIAKLLLNSLYGKFAENPYSTTEQVQGHAAFYKLASATDKILLSVRVIKDDVAEVVWIPLVPDAATASDKKHVCVPLAALITAYARIKLMRTIESIGVKRVLYCDTDSVYYIESPGDPPVPTSSVLGGLEDDLKGGRLVDLFVSTGPKAYGCCVEWSDGKREEKIRLKGFPNVTGNRDVLSRSSMLRAWTEAEYKVVKKLRNFAKHRYTHEVTTVENQRSYRNTFGKRRALRLTDGNIVSVPLGFNLD